MTDSLPDLTSRALNRTHALAEEWQGDQTTITRAAAAELLMEVIQLRGWTQTDATATRHLEAVPAARQITSPARTTGHQPSIRCGHLLAGHTPGTWTDCNLPDGHDGPHTARQTTGQDDTGATLRDRLRRAICEASGFTWDPDTLEPDEYGDHADAVLQVLGEPLPEGKEFAAPAVGQPAEAHDTDTSTWWTIQAQKPTGTWFNLSEGFSSADEARAWRDTELQAANWPLRIVRVEQTATETVEDER